ncbi:MAG: Smr/MutS family protein [Verrucomicrobiota bacterium JB022]|nr:Smr/MutS family protein [Verrucomicrobiota bacterium JB022]
MSDEPIHLPIDGVLDLHQFMPKEAIAVVEAYLEECQKAGIKVVRIIHGKGKGVMRDQVHAYLKRHPEVIGYKLGGEIGGWGATVARLR